MANTKSAAKAQRQSEKRRQEGLARRSALKTAVKKLHAAIAQGTAAEVVETQLRQVAAQLSRARGKGVIKKNTMARTLSRLTLRVNGARPSGA